MDDLREAMVDVIAEVAGVNGKWAGHCADAMMDLFAERGLAIVPVEPTEAMMQAGLYQSSHDAKWEDVFSAWKDMLAAAKVTP